MEHAFSRILQLLEQFMSAIFRMIGDVWTWVAAQVQNLMSVPWQSWPLSKQLVFAFVIVAVAIALLRVASELWSAGERILGAFATLIGVFVRTIPAVAIAGLIAVGGLWTLNNVDLSALKFPTSWQTSAETAPQKSAVQ